MQTQQAVNQTADCWIFVRMGQYPDQKHETIDYDDQPRRCIDDAIRQ